MRVAGVVLSLLVASTAHAAPPEPTRAHPRLWADAKTRAALKDLARHEGTVAARAVQECTRLGATDEPRSGYQGLDWAAHVSTCAIAYQATGNAAHAATGIRYFAALLDDWEVIGDGKGGDRSARNDAGYAIRAFGVHAAIAYDDFHDAPAMTPALLAKARGRFQAWTDWYWGTGYRFKGPGTNYHAGYVFAATAIAIAEGGEAGAAGTKLWQHVVDRVWGVDMKDAAMLDGGDWGEGWQYGPLAVASYALAARAMTENGVALPAMGRWADATVLRQIHALSPDGKWTFAAGDTQAETPSIPPSPLTLAGMIAGPSSPEAAGWAAAEMARLHLTTDDKLFLFFEALAEARGVKATPYPREATPTSYLARGTGAFYARSSWSPAASFLAMQCTKHIDVDHLPANAGNFVLTRGADELLVDPSPYGSLASRTSNAPTVESGQLPEEYKPGQAYWSEKTGYAWERQTASAIVVARCDYADQYKFQDRPSDVPFAERDVVYIPGVHGDATAVVVDRARTGSAKRPLFLTFRTPAALTMDGAVARGVVGRSSLAIASLGRSAGTSVLRKTPKGDCFAKGTTRGGCTAARFPVDDLVVTLTGEDARAIHVLDLAASDAKVAPARLFEAKDHRVVSFDRGARHGAVVVGTGGARLTYRAPPGQHVVLDAPGMATGHAQVTATKDGATCAVTVAEAAAGMDARPLVLAVSDACVVTEDGPETAPVAPSIDGDAPASSSAPRAWSPPPRPTDLFPPPEPPGPAPVPPRAAGCGCETSGPAPLGGLFVFLLAAFVAVHRRATSWR